MNPAQSRYGPSTVPAPSRYGPGHGPGTVPVLSRYSPGTLPARSQYGPDTVPIRSRARTGHGPSTVPVRCRHGPGTVLELTETRCRGSPHPPGNPVGSHPKGTRAPRGVPAPRVPTKRAHPPVPPPWGAASDTPVKTRAARVPTRGGTHWCPLRCPLHHRICPSLARLCPQPGRAGTRSSRVPQQPGCSEPPK